MVSLRSLLILGLVWSANILVMVCQNGEEHDAEKAGQIWCAESYHAVKNDVCFQYFSEPTTWERAFEKCKQEHATLLQFEGANTEDQIDTFKIFISDKERKSHVWLALRRINEYYQWVGQSPQSKKVHALTKLPWGAIWDKNEPSVWDGCVALNLATGKMKTKNCTDGLKPFICQQKALPTKLQPVVSCDESEGWLGLDAQGCIRIGREAKPWKEAKEDCLSEDPDLNPDLVRANRPFQMKYFNVVMENALKDRSHPDDSWVYRYTDCESNETSSNCAIARFYVCFKDFHKPKISVHLTAFEGYRRRYSSNSAIWATNATKSGLQLECEVFVSETSLAKSKVKIQYIWSRNGVYVDYVSGKMIIPALWPTKEDFPSEKEHRLDVIMGTYQCDARLPGIDETYSSNLVSIFIHEFHMFLYTITTKVNTRSKFWDLESTSCSPIQCNYTMTDATNVLKKVLPLDDPQKEGFDGFKWFKHSVRPSNISSKPWSEHYVTFKVFVGANVTSDPLATVEDTLSKLRRYSAVIDGVEIQALERCEDKVIPVGDVSYSLQMLPREPEVFSVPSCVTYGSAGRKLPSTCELSYLKGPQWNLADYTHCLSDESETFCPVDLWPISEEFCAVDFPEEKALSWEDAKNKCHSLKSDLLRPNIESSEVWPNTEETITSWMGIRHNYVVIFDRSNEILNYLDKTTSTERCVYSRLDYDNKWTNWNFLLHRKECSAKMPFTCVSRSVPHFLWEVPWCPKRWLGTQQHSFNKSCFFIHWSQDTTRDGAKRACASMAGNLAFLNRPEAVESLLSTMNQSVADKEFNLHGYWTALDKLPEGLIWTVSSGQTKSMPASISVSNMTGGDSVAFFPLYNQNKTKGNIKKTQVLSSWNAVKRSEKLGFICQKHNSGNVVRNVRINLYKNVKLALHDDSLPYSLTCEALNVPRHSKVYWYKNGHHMEHHSGKLEFIPESSTLRQKLENGLTEGEFWCEVWSFEPSYPVRSNTVTLSSDANYYFVLNYRTNATNRDAIKILQIEDTYRIADAIEVDRIIKVFRGNDVEFYGIINAKERRPKRDTQKPNDVEFVLRDLQARVGSKGLNGKVLYTAGCLLEKTTLKNNVILIWPYTRLGHSALPQQTFELCITANGNSVTRKCLGSFQFGATWGPVEGSCDGRGSNITKSLYKLSQSDITKDTATRTADDLHHLTKDTDQLQPVDITYIATTMHRIAKTGNITRETLHHVASTVDHLISVVEIEKLHESHATSGSSSRITESLEQMLNMVDVGPSQSFHLTLPSLYMESQTITAATPRGKLVVGVASLQEESFNSSSVIQLKEDMNFNYTTTDAALLLPQEFVRNRAKYADSSNPTQLSFIIYVNSRLFVGNQTGNSKIVSRVVTASLSGPAAINLNPPVELLFRPLKHMASLDNASCVYWDVHLAAGRGDWSDAGCWVNTIRENLVVCHCNHLTNFAVLMDVYGQDNPIPPHHKFALDLITYVGCALSILGLSLTILTFFTFKKWRKNNGSKVLCNLAASLLGLMVVFLAGINQTDWPGLCIVVAALLHYFALTSFCWMLMEAVHQYMLFVKVLDTYIPKFIMKAMLFAWGLPLAFVVTIVAVDVNMYRGGERYCWMSLDAIYYTFLLPVGIIVSTNAIVFIMVLKGITCDRSETLRSNQSKRQLAMAQLHASACIFVLLGLTWIFGFLAIASARITFQYLFCISNSLQGLLIFLFMIVRERHAKELWFLFCFRKQADNATTSSSTPKKKKSKLEEHNFSENCTASTKLVTNNSRFSTHTASTT